MDKRRFIGGFPDTGHYDDDMNWVPHHFDETNHPSFTERQRLKLHREMGDREHAMKHGQTLYHGTTKEAAESISRTGFHLDNTTNGRTSGHGVYLTKSKAEAHSYGTHVVEAKVLAHNLHDDPWNDESVGHVHPDHVSAALEAQGWHGHIDTDDNAHVVYNPAHVHVVKVHGPSGSGA